jgi:acetyl esterase/lipase
MKLTLAATPQYFRGSSVQSRVLGFGLRHTVKPALGLWGHIPFDFLPPNLIDAAARLLPVTPGTVWSTITHEFSRSEWLTAPDVAGLDDGNDRAMVYFHGGAFLTLGLNTHRRLVARISATAGQPILSVDYRHMPTSSIYDSVCDGVDAFTWLLEQGYDASNITIAGDSAGGYLAFSVARAVMDRGLGRPAGVVALSPILDFDNAARIAHRNAKRCQTFPAHAVAKLARLAGRVDARCQLDAPRVDPIDMPLADMPPALIQVGSHEILMSDAEIMAGRLVAAGVPCDLQVWEKQVHVFQAAASWVPEARAAIAEIGAFIASVAQQREPLAVAV